MVRRSVLLVALAVLSVLLLITFDGAFARHPELPSVSLVVPGQIARDPIALDRVYHRLVNVVISSFPACTDLRAYHRLTPQGSTAVVTVRCRAWKGEHSRALPQA